MLTCDLFAVANLLVSDKMQLVQKTAKDEKALRQTQTLRAAYKIERKKIAPPQTPCPGAREGQNLISWRWSLPSHTDPV